ncbi:hypothetical protein AB0C84_43500 [Actinomadura sp. NPDC048955]|uniref:hypothetical protein n=1 Tax=Actinomadura sp. NPDC048955 TaxID=3158228 RepID=UPI0033F983A2
MTDRVVAASPTGLDPVGEVVSQMQSITMWIAFLTYASHQHGRTAAPLLLVWNRFGGKPPSVGPFPVPREELAEIIGALTDDTVRTRVNAAFTQAAAALPLPSSAPSEPSAKSGRRRGQHARASSSLADKHVSAETPRGPISFTVAIDWSHGRVRYEVDRIGVFWLSPSDEYGPDNVRIQYGDDGENYFQRAGYQARPNAPQVFGITIVGTAVVNPSYAKPTENGWVNVRRRGADHYSVSAPTATSQRIAQIVYALLNHYQKHPDLKRIRVAQARYRAPARLAAHQRTATKLTERITELETERAQAMKAAAAQQALLDQPPPGPAEPPAPAPSDP